jgi:tetratricopeptide (TPR) repeat protein
MQLGELLVRRADERFAVGQRAGNDTTARPDYREAIARYAQCCWSSVRSSVGARSPPRRTLYSQQQRYPEAVKAFETLAGDSSTFTSEALFRLGDSYFEIAAKERGAARGAGFARAATAYERAAAIAPHNGDIYFLSLYKLGWSYYNQATQTSQAEYSKAVDVFGRLIDAYDKLSPQQQARLGLRAETIEYMSVAFTQVGGAEAANRYFAAHGGAGYRLPVMQRVAFNLQEQGDFARAVSAYEAVISQAPTDSNAVRLQRDIVDINQNRMLEPERAQQARLELVTRFGPESQWARANANNKSVMDTAAAIREELRRGAQYASVQAQQGTDKHNIRMRRRCTIDTREFLRRLRRW